VTIEKTLRGVKKKLGIERMSGKCQEMMGVLNIAGGCQAMLRRHKEKH
jgi:hypothetical protein